MITERQLRQIAPACEDPAGWVKPLNAMFARFKFDRSTVQRFLAQALHESSNLNRVEENLRYNAKRILEVWPKRFPKGEKESQLFAYNPVKLANRVYANRNGNGPEECGDGYRYRGRGLLQITGRANYKAVGDLLHIDLLQFPDALLERKFAALSAGAYWTANVKSPPGVPHIESDTIAITGSKMALAERQKLYGKIMKVMSDASDYGNPGSAVRQTASSEAPQKAEAWFD